MTAIITNLTVKNSQSTFDKQIVVYINPYFTHCFVHYYDKSNYRITFDHDDYSPRSRVPWGLKNCK